MIWISFDTWSSKAGSVFLYYRIYLCGWKWTPFVYMIPRWTTRGRQ